MPAMAPLQPAHAQKIVHAHQQTAEIRVFGCTLKARAVVDRHIGDAPAFALRQRDQEAVHVIEIGQAQEHVAMKGFQAAAGVAGAVAQQGIAQAVAQPRGQPPAGLVLALDAHARHHGQAGIGPQHGQQLGRVGRIVLAVAIQGDDDAAPGRHHAGADAAALAEIAGMAQNPKRWNFRLQRPQFRRRRIGRAVIHKDDLMGFGLQGSRNLPGQGADIAGLVLDRHDHGNGYAACHFCSSLVSTVGTGPYTGPALCNIGAGPT